MKFLSSAQVCKRIALSRATLDRMVNAGDFPAPLRLTERRLAYKEADVDDWMAEKAEKNTMVQRFQYRKSEAS